MIEIDVDYFYQFFAQFIGLDPMQIAWILLFKYWGWLIFVYIFLRYLIWPEYIYARQNDYFAKQGAWVLLAIDVPKRNEQSMQAMENFFDHLLGLHGTFTKWEIYVKGAFQLSLSVELVSIEGNIQFVIRCPEMWRNAVEAAVYGQYPNAEITEVEDYVNIVPTHYPDEKWDVWGVEFTLSAPEHLPIKSWRKFEHNFTDAIFVDPMAALLETMSSIGPGQHMWLQMILNPLPVDWGTKYKKEVDKLMEKALPAAAPGILSSVISQTGTLVDEFTAQLAGFSMQPPVKDEKVLMKFPNLSPGVKERVEEVERKLAHLAFNAKIRYVYVAEKDKMNKAIGANAIVGSLKQWTDMNANGLKPDMKATGTSRPYYYLVDYRKNSRKNRIMWAYRKRSGQIGCVSKPLCTEELASLWHFPSINVKSPLLKTTSFIKAAGPVGLPFQEKPLKPVSPRKIEEVIADKSANLPTFDYDNDAFEMQFAKDKQAFKNSRPARAKKLQELDKEDAEKMKKMWAGQANAAPQTGVPEAAVKPRPVAPQRETTIKKDKEPLGNLPFID